MVGHSCWTKNCKRESLEYLDGGGVVNNNPERWITWLVGRRRTQQTARHCVKCRSHEHRHVERTLLVRDPGVSGHVHPRVGIDDEPETWACQSNCVRFAVHIMALSVRVDWFLTGCTRDRQDSVESSVSSVACVLGVVCVSTQTIERAPDLHGSSLVSKHNIIRKAHGLIGVCSVVVFALRASP